MFYAMKQVLLVTVFVCLSAPAFAASWQKVSEGTVGSQYIDMSSVRQARPFPKTVDSATAWTLTDFKKPLTNGKTSSSSLKIMQSFDCVGERMTQTAIVAYVGHMATGKVVYSEDIVNEWIPIREGTQGHDMMTLVCGKGLGAPGILSGINLGQES